MEKLKRIKLKINKRRKLASILGIFICLFFISAFLSQKSLGQIGSLMAGYGYGYSFNIVLVPEGYPTIQEAIEAAEEGDIVLVASGVYYENLSMKEGVDIVAREAGVVIDGGGQMVIGEICHNNISGFTIRNAGQNNIIMATSDECNRDKSTIDSNVIDGLGEARLGIFVRGNTRITNNTIVNMACEECEQGGNGIKVASGRPAITNNIFYQNRYGISCNNSGSSILYNNFWQNSAGEYEGSCEAGEGNRNVPPRFIDSQNSDYHLAADSLLIDQGYGEAENSFRTDFDGEPRIMDGRADGRVIIDIGADEFKSDYMEVSGLIETNTIWRSEASPYKVTGNILVNKGVILTIEPGTTVIMCNNCGIRVDGGLVAKGRPDNKIVFMSENSTPTPGDWEGIFFTDSSQDAEFDSDGNYYWGNIISHTDISYAKTAIKADSSSPYILGNHIYNNNASDEAAIYLHYSQSSIINNTIENNIGRGLYYIYGSSSNNQYVQIKKNVIRYNNSSSYGGGMYVNNGYLVLVENNIINDNSTTDYGGGIYLSGSHVEFRGNKVFNNTSNSSGGGLYVTSYSTSLVDNIIFNNIANDGGGIYYNSYNANIDYNVIRNNSCRNSTCGAGLKFSNSTYNLSFTRNNVLMNEGSAGLLFSDSGSNNDLNNNNFRNPAAQYELYLSNTDDHIDATNNFWGIPVENIIQERIYDYNDDFDLGYVYYEPFLTEPYPDTPSE